MIDEYINREKRDDQKQKNKTQKQMIKFIFLFITLVSCFTPEEDMVRFRKLKWTVKMGESECSSKYTVLKADGP